MKKNLGGRGKTNEVQNRAVVILKRCGMRNVDIAKLLPITEGRIIQIYNENKDKPLFQNLELSTP